MLTVVKKSVTVAVDRQRAFEVFTTRLMTWWPPEYHIGAADMADFVIEPKAGGRWYEVGVDGSECDTGRVLVFDPPRRLVLAWHITEEWGYDPDPEHSSEVEVQFIAESASRTRVELEHRGFERHGAGGAQIRDVVDGPGGWDALLPRYGEAASTK